MVQNARFFGLPVENPIAHLNNFERICGLFKLNGVSPDAFKLRLFPFSLGDKAQLWELHLPPGSITTWEECKDAFMAKFYTIARTARLRNEISGFTQRKNETFSEAFERYKSFQIECPHHGYSDENLLSILYRGVLPHIRTNLDIASNGSFLQRDAYEGWQLIDNMVASDGIYGEDYDRAPRGTPETDNRDIRSINDKLDRLLSDKPRKSLHVSFADQVVTEHEDEPQFEEINYVQNQGPNNYQRNQGSSGQNQGNFRQNQGNYGNKASSSNLSYRSTNVENPQDQTYPPHQQPQTFAPKKILQNPNRAPQSPPPQAYYPPQHQTQPPTLAPLPFPPPVQHLTPQPNDISAVLQQILHEQTSTNQHISQMQSDIRRLDVSHLAVVDDLKQLNSRLQHVEDQQASSSQVRSTGQLPGKAIQNPKAHSINTITIQISPASLLSSGDNFPSPSIIPSAGPISTVDSSVQVGGQLRKLQRQPGFSL